MTPQLKVHLTEYDDLCERLVDSCGLVEPDLPHVLDEYDLTVDYEGKRSRVHMAQGSPVCKKLIIGGRPQLQVIDTAGVGQFAIGRGINESHIQVCPAIST